MGRDGQVASRGNAFSAVEQAVDAADVQDRVAAPAVAVTAADAAPPEQDGPVDDAPTGQRPAADERGAQPEDDASVRELRELGEVVAVFSSKGGVGTSFLATRLALIAAGLSPLHTVLVDLDLTGGDAPSLVGVQLERSLLEWLAPADHEQHPAVTELASVHPSGLEVLGSLPLDPRAGGVDGAAITALLQALRACYDVVLVDVPAAIDDRTVTAVAAADRAIIVTVPEQPCLRQVSLFVEALGSHDLPVDHLVVVHNMDRRRTHEAMATATSLGLPLLATIPDAPRPVRAAVNAAGVGGGGLFEQRLGKRVDLAVYDAAVQLWPETLRLHRRPRRHRSNQSGRRGRRG